MANKTNRRGALATRVPGHWPPMGGDMQSQRSFMIRWGTYGDKVPKVIPPPKRKR